MAPRIKRISLGNGRYVARLTDGNRLESPTVYGLLGAIQSLLGSREAAAAGVAIAESGGR